MVVVLVSDPGLFFKVNCNAGYTRPEAHALIIQGLHARQPLHMTHSSLS